MEKFDYLVIGGGFRAIAAAWGLARQGHRTALVEASAKIGGFLSPIHWDGHWIDKGPQFFDNFEPEDVRLIEEMIGPDVMQDIGFEYASFMGGILNCDFAIPDWQSLGDDVARQAFQDLLALRLAANGDAPTPETFDDLLAWDGGPTLLPHLRALTKKFVGREASELSAAARTMVTFLGRKKLFGQEASVDLKKSPLLDTMLAAKKASVSEDRANLYPKGSSLETVRLALEKALEAAGVRVFTETVLDSFDAKAGVARGKTAEIDFEWLFFGTDIRESERMLTGGSSIAECTYVVPEIFHCYVVSVSSVVAPYYVVDYDVGHVSTRITNFCNYMGAVDDEGYGIRCVEEPVGMGDARWNDPEAGLDAIFAEARETGAVTAQSYKVAKSFRVPATYKVPLVGFEDAVEAFRAAVAAEFGDRAVMPDVFGLTRKAAIDDLRDLGVIA